VGVRVIKNWEQLARSRLHEDVLRVLEVGLRAADPRSTVRRALSLRGSRLCVHDLCTEAGRGVHVVGFGKASIGMALGCEDSLGDRVLGGIVIAPTRDVPELPKAIEVSVGDHPIPREGTLKASARLVEYLEGNLREGDVVLVLISGGGSALFEIPYPPLDLSDIALTTDLLMRAGADIVELNTVRKHLSLVKGGRFLRMLEKAGRVFSLIISDVVGDPVEFIASGPTEADSTTFRDALEVLRRRGVWGRVPERVRELISAGAEGRVPETLKPGDPLLAKVSNVIVASNVISLREMKREAEALGYRTRILTSMMVGEAREVGRFLGGLARYVAKYELEEGKTMILLGGETTVTVRGRGIGGRNQELCVGYSIVARGLRNSVLASIGSDGVDGNSPAAGGICDGGAFDEALNLGLNPYEYLDRNDTYTLLSRLGRAIVTGPTGTNVNDLTVLALSVD
jgi:glycerate 2-kinase